MNKATQLTGEWQPVDSEGRLYRAQYQADFGEPYSLLVKIDAQTALVYSPGPGLVESARNLLPSDPKLILVAPSTGHTMGLRAWSETFADSRVAASSGARGRILEKTKLPVVFDTQEISAELPDWITLIDIADNPFGECWLRVTAADNNENDDGTVYWAVCDALMNLDSLGSNPLLKLLLKWYGLGEGLHVHQRFRRGIRDKQAFAKWASQQLGAAPRQMLIPCHGEIASGEQLGDQLIALINRNFPA